MGAIPYLATRSPEESSRIATHCWAGNQSRFSDSIAFHPGETCSRLLLGQQDFLLEKKPLRDLLLGPQDVLSLGNPPTPDSATGKPSNAGLSRRKTFERRAWAWEETF